MEGIISKPQFDYCMFEVGTAIHIDTNASGEWYGFNHDCLVVNFNPLEIKVAYVKASGALEHRVIPVSDVVDKLIKIKFLEEKKGE